MGRSKVVIQPISQPAKRRATFQKRRAGVMKKAMELSVLCHCDIALVLFDEHGNLYQFASHDIRKTLTRAFKHRGKKDSSTNETLLRKHGVTKEKVETATEAPIGHQIDLTPASTCGLELSAQSFGVLLKGVECPESPPTSPPPPPERNRAIAGFGEHVDEFDVGPDKRGAPRFQKTLPPKVQRSVDALMRDISLMHKADELINDPSAMSMACEGEGLLGNRLLATKPALHVMRPDRLSLVY